jgi:DNA-binding transcriptional regulator YiaG
MTMPTKNTSAVPQQKPRWVLAKCVHCHQDFRVPKSRATGENRQRFCSASCGGRAKAKPKVTTSAQNKKVPAKKTSARKMPVEIKLPSKIKYPQTPEQLLALRRSLNLGQSAFWLRLGVTQSGGSRYENGRPLPVAVGKLLDAVYIKGVALERLNANDFAILEFLKTQHPDLYTSLDKAARGMERRL